MNMYEALMECQRRLNKPPEFVADTEARMKATPGMIKGLQAQEIEPGQEETVIEGLIKEALYLEANRPALTALQIHNRMLAREAKDN